MPVGQYCYVHPCREWSGSFTFTSDGATCTAFAVVAIATATASAATVAAAAAAAAAAVAAAVVAASASVLHAALKYQVRAKCPKALRVLVGRAIRFKGSSLQCCASASRTSLFSSPISSGTADSSSCRCCRSWGSSFARAINALFDFGNSPVVGLQTHTAVFSTVAIAAITAGFSTAGIEVQAIQVTCAAFAVSTLVTTGVSLGSHSAVFTGVAADAAAAIAAAAAAAAAAAVAAAAVAAVVAASALVLHAVLKYQVRAKCPKALRVLVGRAIRFKGSSLQCCASASRTSLFSSPISSGTADSSGCRCCRSWGSSVTSAINVPLDFRNGPVFGLQTHTAVFAAVAIVTAGVSTTEVSIWANAASGVSIFRFWNLEQY